MRALLLPIIAQSVVTGSMLPAAWSIDLPPVPVPPSKTHSNACCEHSLGVALAAVEAPGMWQSRINAMRSLMKVRPIAANDMSSPFDIIPPAAQLNSRVTAIDNFQTLAISPGLLDRLGQQSDATGLLVDLASRPEEALEIRYAASAWLLALAAQQPFTTLPQMATSVLQRPVVDVWLLVALAFLALVPTALVYAVTVESAMGVVADRPLFSVARLVDTSLARLACVALWGVLLTSALAFTAMPQLIDEPAFGWLAGPIPLLFAPVADQVVFQLCVVCSGVLAALACLYIISSMPLISRLLPMPWFFSRQAFSHVHRMLRRWLGRRTVTQLAVLLIAAPALTSPPLYSHTLARLCMQAPLLWAVVVIVWPPAVSDDIVAAKAGLHAEVASAAAHNAADVGYLMREEPFARAALARAGAHTCLISLLPALAHSVEDRSKVTGALHTICLNRPYVQFLVIITAAPRVCFELLWRPDPSGHLHQLMMGVWSTVLSTPLIWWALGSYVAATGTESHLPWLQYAVGAVGSGAPYSIAAIIDADAAFYSCAFLLLPATWQLSMGSRLTMWAEFGACVAGLWVITEVLDPPVTLPFSSRAVPAALLMVELRLLLDDESLRDVSLQSFVTYTVGLLQRLALPLVICSRLLAWLLSAILHRFGIGVGRRAGARGREAATPAATPRVDGSAGSSSNRRRSRSPGAREPSGSSDAPPPAAPGPPPGLKVILATRIKFDKPPLVLGSGSFGEVVRSQRDGFQGGYLP